MSQEVELLTEIRDLLLVIAEPALDKRDAKLRSILRTTVGGSRKKAQAVLLMNGVRSRGEIISESRIDAGDLSRLLKALAANNLIGADERKPKLLVTIPSNFFDANAEHE